MILFYKLYLSYFKLSKNKYIFDNKSLKKNIFTVIFYFLKLQSFFYVIIYIEYN